MNCGGLTSHMNGCKGDPETITIPRDLHDLYKEAAEEWAKERTDPEEWNCCRACHASIRFDPQPHAHNCKAARILGLNREGEG